MKTILLTVVLLCSTLPAFGEPETDVQLRAPIVTVQQPTRGLGALGVRTETFSNRILEIYPNSSLKEQGLKVGDFILEVNGVAVRGKAFQNAAIGQPGTSVTLKVRHVDEEGNNVDRLVRVERRDIRNFTPLDSTYRTFTPSGVK